MHRTWLLLPFLWLVLDFPTSAKCEVYSSASNMRTVFNIERELVDILDGYAQKLEAKLAKINGYMKVLVILLSRFRKLSGA